MHLLGHNRPQAPPCRRLTSVGNTARAPIEGLSERISGVMGGYEQELSSIVATLGEYVLVLYLIGIVIHIGPYYCRPNLDMTIHLYTLLYL